jgi:hypothetical protein
MKKPIIVTTTILLFLSLTSFGQVSPQKVQSLFIYNFTKHIKWPSTGESFVIGILGKSAITEELSATMKGKTVDGKNIEVKVLSSLGEAGTCQMLYVPSGKSKELIGSIASVGKEVLVVTESDLMDKGAGISFLTVDEKLKFKINEQVLSKGGLQVTGSLLSLAAR